MLLSHELASWEIMNTTAAPAIQELDLVPKDQDYGNMTTIPVATSLLGAAKQITEKNILKLTALSFFNRRQWKRLKQVLIFSDSACVIIG